MGFDADAVDAGRDAGALPPAARRDRHHPRPRRPGHGRAGRRAGSASAEALDLLDALTEADARADRAEGVVHAGAPAWSLDLPAGAGARRSTPAARCPPVAERRSRSRPRHAPAGSSVAVERRRRRRRGSRVVARDRVGLLADVAAFRAAAGRRCGPPGPGRRSDYGVLRVGGRRRAPRRGGRSGSGSTRSRRPPRRRRSGCAPPTPGRSSRRSSYAPRPSAQRDRARGPGRRPARGGLPGLRRARGASGRGPLGARRHPRPAGGRRVLPAGGPACRRSLSERPAGPPQARARRDRAALDRDRPPSTVGLSLD